MCVWKQFGNQLLGKLNEMECCWDNIKMDLEVKVKGKVKVFL
jgi:hypothetical protein